MQDMQFYQEDEDEYNQLKNMSPTKFQALYDNAYSYRSYQDRSEEQSIISNVNKEQNSLMADLRGSFHGDFNLSNLPEQNTQDYMDCARSSAPSLMSVALTDDSCLSDMSHQSSLSKLAGAGRNNGELIQQKQQQKQQFNKEICQQNWESQTLNNSNMANSSSSSFMNEGGEVNTLPAAQEEAQPQQKEKKERVFYADWIRASAIILVIFVHCLVNSFDASGLQPDDVPDIQQKKDGIIKCLVQIGIPMFFYISGIGATFFDTEKNHFGIFVGGKVLRLLVPFIAAIFVFLIPRLYFGQEYEDYTRPNDEIENDYWEFMKKTLPTIYLKLSWLWYLPALFIDIMLTYPLLRWSIRRSRKIPFDPATDFGIIVHQLVTLAAWAAINYYLVTTDDYGELYLLPSIGVLTCVMFSFYFAQLLINRQDGQGYYFAIWIKFIGPIGGIFLCLFKLQTENMNLYHIFLMVNFDAIFFSQGVVDMCYWKQMQKARGEIANTSFAPAAIVGFIFVYSITCPMNYSQMGQLFFYPLYTDYWLQCFYVLGTWIWLTAIVWTMAHIGNEKFNDTIYNYVCGSALYAYVSHYFFILILSVMVIRPNKIGFIGAFFIMFFGTQFLILITYVPLNWLYELIVPPKEYKKMSLNPDEEEEVEAQTPEQEAAAAAAAKAEALEGEKRSNGAAMDLENADVQSGASDKNKKENNE